MLLSLSFPRSDAGLLDWSQNVVSTITPTPAAWGLVVGDVTSYTALHDAYAASLALCTPSLRNKTNVVAKNAARLALKNGAFVLGNKIYASPLVTDAMKVQIGMPPRANPQPRPAPSSAPVIEVIDANDWTVRIRLKEAGGTGRGKPPFVIGASVFSFVGTSAPTNLSQWKFEGNCGRVNKIDVSFSDSLSAGTKVWLTAFWFNGRKQSGPMTDPVSVNLPGGGVAMAA